MRKLFIKTIALVATIMMVGTYFLPAGVYAANEIKQNSDTKEENVKFNATINGSYETEADINSEAILELALSVLEAGYLKDVKVSLNNNNYSLGEVTDENVNLVEDNSLELSEVNSSEELNVKLPIKYNKNETVVGDELSRESEVKLQATYVNQKGKEKEIEKTITEKLTWKTNSTEVVSQELNRYIKYDNKTLVTFEMKEGILNNTIPVESKEVSVIVPKIGNVNPTKVIVNGNNIDYKYENGIVTITKNMKNEDNKYVWNSEDAYTLTYIYDSQTTATSLSTSAQAKVVTINNETLEGASEINEFEITDEIGSLVEIKTEGDTQLNKGYMHTNNKRTANKLDTTYNTIYKVNIGYADVIDKIIAKEDTATFENEDGETVKNADDSLKTTKVKVDEKQLIDILGTDGNIVVKDENDSIIGKINSENNEIQLEASKITFEISKPAKEGTISIETEKAIKGDSENSKEEIDEYKNLKTNLHSNAYNGEQEVSDSNITSTITLNEATSKAKLDISTDRLSTIVKNENVSFNIVLSKKDIEDALYTNPVIKLRLPEQVTNIEMLSGNLLYENELKPSTSEINGNEITINLEGTQTEYNSSTTSDGALIRFETNLTLNNLAPSSVEKVQLECINEYTGEVVKAEKEMNIIAPTGFVTTNTIKVEDKEATAVEKDAELIKLKTAENSRTMEVEANLVNNIDANAEGLVVLGRIPTTGNKTVGGLELGTNIDTKLTSPIELVNLENSTVYYSTNSEETLEGSGWTTEATEATKSFMIVNNGSFENKKMASFKYTVEIPENLDYEKTAKENYGVYYNNDAQEGITRNLVESKIVGITTGSAPEIKAEITANDTNEGFTIDNGKEIEEGEFITYKLTLSNTGSNDANNVKVNTLLPDALGLVEKEIVQGEVGTGFTINKETKNIEQTIDTLKGGESKTFYFDTVVNQKIDTLESEDNANIEIGFTVEADILDDRIERKYTLKNTEGTINSKLATNAVSSVSKNERFNYILNIYNSNYKDKENVKATIKLPQGVKFDKVESGQKAEYNEKQNEVNVEVGQILAGTNSVVTIKAINNSNEDELKASATVKCDGSDKNVKSNEVVLNNIVTDRSIQVTHTSNISNEMMDSEKIEYYIDMKNTSKETISLNVKDIISEELIVNKYYITVEGQEIYSSSTSYINNDITIPAGQSARVTIIAEPLEFENGNRKEIVNKPEISINGGETIQVDEIKIKIKGSIPVVKEEIAEQGKIENSEVKTETKKYRISGTVWYDENKNGQRDTDEPRLKGTKLTLYSSDTKEIAKDKNNNEIQVITDVNGNYTFSDLEAGEYIVVSQYNSNDYQITSYKEEKVSESINSDFVDVKIEGRDSATTDIIKVENDNAYGIDLGLIIKDKFDLEISESISKITVINSDNSRKEYSYNENSAKIELSDEDVKNSTLLIEYNINVRNNGNVEGYAKSIVNYIPEGLTFNSEYNKDWYLSKDGNLYTVSLANQKIQPGESESVKLVLVKRIKEEGIGIIRGSAEINSTYNEKGLAEINALSSKKANTSSADVIVAKKTKVSAISVLSITIGLIAVFSIILYQMKKIIDKEYNIDE